MNEQGGLSLITNKDRQYLERCVELARTALEVGDQPFGSLLVSQDGEVLFEDHNHISGGDNTQHPEFAIARWAAEHLAPEERANATVYTSGEHCPMCAAAHGLVGLGRIVYASSSKQFQQWQKDLGISGGNVNALAIQEVITNTDVDGPADDLAEEVRKLHYKYYGNTK